jgi:hypothetical protein
VTLLAINADRTDSYRLEVPLESSRYTLTARELTDTAIELNGSELKLNSGSDVPSLAGASTPAGEVTLTPASITFLSMPGAKNSSCR